MGDKKVSIEGVSSSIAGAAGTLVSKHPKILKTLIDLIRQNEIAVTPAVLGLLSGTAVAAIVAGTAVVL